MTELQQRILPTRRLYTGPAFEPWVKFAASVRS